MLPILRNTVTGIRGVDPAVVEAARGVGMTTRQQLRRVELPLALPVIVAGIRTATVWIVGIATLSTPVGAPSLGNYIFSGLQTRNLAAVLVGCVAAAALALLLDGLVRALEVGVRTRPARALVARRGARRCSRSTRCAGVSARAVRRAAPRADRDRRQDLHRAVRPDRDPRRRDRARDRALRPRVVARRSARRSPSTRSRAARIDVYVDYTGTLWATIMQRTDAAARSARSCSRRSAAISPRRHGIDGRRRARLRERLRARDARRDARAGSASRTHQRPRRATPPRSIIAGDYEFFSRPEWARARAHATACASASERSMDPSLMYQARSRARRST